MSPGEPSSNADELGLERRFPNRHDPPNANSFAAKKRRRRKTEWDSASSLSLNSVWGYSTVSHDRPELKHRSFFQSMAQLRLAVRHLTPDLSPIEVERENYRQSVGEFVTIRVIRVKGFALFVTFCGNKCGAHRVTRPTLRVFCVFSG